MIRKHLGSEVPVAGRSGKQRRPTPQPRPSHNNDLEVSSGKDERK